MMHPRVVNIRAVPKGSEPVYVGRGTKWGNPFTLSAYGPECMRMFLDWLDGEQLDANGDGGGGLVYDAQRELVGRNLACHCAGRYPVCHAEVYAYLADGKPLAEIRAEMLGRIGLS